MQLEDLTKEEIIRFVRTDWRLQGSEETIVKDCLLSRLNKIQKRLNKARNKTTRLLQEYSDFLKPYKGKNIFDIPRLELLKGASIEENLKQAQAKEEKLIAQYEQLRKLIMEEEPPCTK